MFILLVDIICIYYLHYKKLNLVTLLHLVNI